jgi:4'-phosphopantetheinyl transferase EntD
MGSLFTYPHLGFGHMLCLESLENAKAPKGLKNNNLALSVCATRAGIESLKALEVSEREREIFLSSSLMKGQSRLWPSGIVGSVSHSNPQAITLCAKRTNDLLNVGVDLECITHRPFERIAKRLGLRSLASLGPLLKQSEKYLPKGHTLTPSPGMPLPALLSAIYITVLESAFKALSPLYPTLRLVSSLQCTLSINEGILSVVVSSVSLPRAFHGNVFFSFFERYLITSLFIKNR